MRVGVAITTYNRSKHLANCLSQIRKHSPASTMIYVSDDSQDRKGVAYRKTDCLEALWAGGCDYFFLLDDDCFPIADGWIDFFIEARLRTGQEHFCYTPSKFKMSSKEGINVCEHSKGVLLFLTRTVVTMIGAFYGGYKLFGCEHTTYTQRIHRAGFTSMGTDLSLVGAEKYLYAMDFDTGLGFNQELNHHSTITQADKNLLYKENRCRLDQDQVLYLPLPLSKKGLRLEEEICIIGEGSSFQVHLTDALRARGYRLTEKSDDVICLVFRVGEDPIPHLKRFIVIQDNLPYTPLLQQALQVWEQNESNLVDLQAQSLHPVLVSSQYLPWEVMESST